MTTDNGQTPPMSTNSILVIFATYNGSQVLNATLQAYTLLASPLRPWRLLVVDNNSNDDTGLVLASYKNKLPLEILHVPIQGKNTAINVGLRQIIDTDYFVILTDDDAIPNPEFLYAWRDVVDKNPEINLFGGKVVPLFIDGKPEYLTSFEYQFDVLYAANDRKDSEISARFIFGPNMAVRADIFRAGFSFDEHIGPNSSDVNYPMGSETEFCVRVEREAKVRSLLTSRPVVRHQIRARQTTMPFVAGRAYRHGLGFARQMNQSISFRMKVKSTLKLVYFRVLTLCGSKRAFWQYNWLVGFLGKTRV